MQASAYLGLWGKKPYCGRGGQLSDFVCVSAEVGGSIATVFVVKAKQAHATVTMTRALICKVARRCRTVDQNPSHTSVGCSEHLLTTQRLQCSSFLVMAYFLLRDYNILPKKGTTFEPLGSRAAHRPEDAPGLVTTRLAVEDGRALDDDAPHEDC